MTEPIAVLQRKYRALELRKHGWPYRRIAEELGVSATQARADVMEALDEVKLSVHEKAEELREVIIERLNSAIEAIYDEVEAGNLYALDRFLKLNAQLAEVSGVKIDRVDLTSGGEPLSALTGDKMKELMDAAKEELQQWKLTHEIE